MSRLTVFSLYVIALVVICAFVWDYRHTKSQLSDARRDLVTAQHNFDQCTAARQSDAAYAAALHNQASASQQNCAQTILNTQKLFELALPTSPVPVRTDFAGSESRQNAPALSPPNGGPAGPNDFSNIQVNDHAFTNFLNTW